MNYQPIIVNLYSTFTIPDQFPADPHLAAQQSVIYFVNYFLFDLFCAVPTPAQIAKF
ncbi:MAG: hypothetical protein RLZZ592_1047 [Pseudomonadota bacterium]|jgi:hypothetical protein